jgi:hypothetical protein
VVASPAVDAGNPEAELIQNILEDNLRLRDDEPAENTDPGPHLRRSSPRF